MNAVKVETVNTVAANGMYIRKVTRVRVGDRSVMFMERVSKRLALFNARGRFAAESALTEDPTEKQALLECVLAIDAAILPQSNYGRRLIVEETR